MSQPYLDWPPPYQIKISARSRRMTIRISSHKGLEIIIPKRTSQQKAVEFLNLKYDWVQKHRHLLRQAVSDPSSLPSIIDLKTIGEKWKVLYEQKISKKLLVSEATQTILIRDKDIEFTASILKKWLKNKAQWHLSDLTSFYGKQYNFTHRQVKVRLQQSRWGSCTRQGNISLNCKLMLLAPELTHYIIVHELVHTLHFNHSPDFWHTVEKFVPNHVELRSQLKNIEQELPNWLYY